MEQLYAAVRCGADAVYLGATGFNARRNAANFDGETLPLLTEEHLLTTMGLKLGPALKIRAQVST